MYEPTLRNYARAFDPLYLRVLLTSVKIAGIATVAALLLGFPAAYAIATAPRRWRLVLLLLVIIPFWTSFLIRTYAWMVLLNPTGVINDALLDTGLIEAPLDILYNDFAVVLGLTYSYLPLMVLPIYAALERLGPVPEEAAEDLYATRWQTMRKVTIPLSAPGIAAGCIFVFVPSLGNFLVPNLLGGGQTVMVGNLIQQQFLSARDWPFGAVFAVGVMLIMGVVLVLQARLLRRSQEPADA
jgi:spermidine/putrescine transport system permease protein